MDSMDVLEWKLRNIKNVESKVEKMKKNISIKFRYLLVT